MATTPPRRKTASQLRAEELAEWKRKREAAKLGLEYEEKAPRGWSVAYTPSKGLAEVNGRPVSVLGDATNQQQAGPRKEVHARPVLGDATNQQAPVLGDATNQPRPKRKADAPITHPQPPALRAQAKENKENGHGANGAQRKTALPAPLGENLLGPGRHKTPLPMPLGERPKTAPPEKASARAAPAAKREVPKASKIGACLTPPADLVVRLEALAKKAPAERNDDKWKAECELLMSKENLHSSAHFWVVRSQYAELMRPRTEQKVRAVVTPIVIGLEGGAEPQEPLQRRALRLVQKLFGDWKKVGHARDMAGQLQFALRKKFKNMPHASAVAPKAKERPQLSLGEDSPDNAGPALRRVAAAAQEASALAATALAKAEAVESVDTVDAILTPRGKAELEVLEMFEGSPGTGNVELEHLYMDADWTAGGYHVELDEAAVFSPEEVAAAEAALDAAVQSGSAAELDRAIQDAEGKGVQPEAVAVAQRVLVAAMRGEEQ